MTSGASHSSEPSSARVTAVCEARLHLPDVHATLAAGARLASCVRPGMLITLSGELGTGKTTLVRGVLQALGWPGAVKSPTYTLVEHYAVSSLYFYHFDFYRLDDQHEWETAGFADYFSDDAVCLVEWPERVREYLPVADLAIELAYVPHSPDSGREIKLRAHSPAGEQCLSALSAAPA